MIDLSIKYKRKKHVEQKLPKKKNVHDLGITKDVKRLALK